MCVCLSEVACWIATGERQAARIRSLYLKTILRQEVAFFDMETNTGEVVGRMSGDTVLIQDAMCEKVLNYCRKSGVLVILVHIMLDSKRLAYAGWKVYTTHIDIHWRHCDSIHQRVASNTRLDVHYSTSCGSRSSNVHYHSQNVFQRTKCLCESCDFS